MMGSQGEGHEGVGKVVPVNNEGAGVPAGSCAAQGQRWQGRRHLHATCSSRHAGPCRLCRSSTAGCGRHACGWLVDNIRLAPAGPMRTVPSTDMRGAGC